MATGGAVCAHVSSPNRTAAFDAATGIGGRLPPRVAAAAVDASVRYGQQEIGPARLSVSGRLKRLLFDEQYLVDHNGSRETGSMALKRMDNVGIVVEDLDATIDFFGALGLALEGRATIEGEWAGRVTGLGDQHVEIAMMRTPDGHSRLELCRFLRPAVVADHRNAPVNALGYLCQSAPNINIPCLNTCLKLTLIESLLKGGAVSTIPASAAIFRALLLEGCHTLAPIEKTTSCLPLNP